MNRNSNTYTFIYASVMVIVVAALLSYAAISLKPNQKRNVEIEKKQNILSSVNIESTPKTAEALYAEKITNSYVINHKGELVDGVNAFEINLKKERAKKKIEEKLFPVYEANLGESGIKYVIPMYGAGLWGPVWGYISFEKDLNTIYGAFFDHQGETPGLGAEIATAEFRAPFKGKRVFDETGKFVSINVAKKGEKADEAHKVDAITGGTITSKGLQQMIFDDLTCYLEFFNQKKQ
jgi:Na+-transporting NADH:ubiquinone oxidoreductase subunit C